jgi:hypothetical protein
VVAQAVSPANWPLLGLADTFNNESVIDCPLFADPTNKSLPDRARRELGLNLQPAVNAAEAVITEGGANHQAGNRPSLNPKSMETWPSAWGRPW